VILFNHHVQDYRTEVRLLLFHLYRQLFDALLEPVYKIQHIDDQGLDALLFVNVFLLVLDIFFENVQDLQLNRLYFAVYLHLEHDGPVLDLLLLAAVFLGALFLFRVLQVLYDVIRDNVP
jgi:hypothetical protein